MYAIYVPNVTCKVPGCLYAAYGQYLRPVQYHNGEHAYFFAVGIIDWLRYLKAL